MNNSNEAGSLAQVLLVSTALTADIEHYTELGFRLDNIFPDDDPTVAVMSGYGIQIRLDKTIQMHASLIPLPNAEKVSFPPTQHKFEVRKLEDNEPWVIGRAGMLYRDLLPDRLGGSIIASHIRIPDGGPVPDMVHYHTIGFQLIFCYKGWVKLVYEDQGPAFILEAGDCVTQPPQIRHRVLEASDNLEVIEVGVPAEHMTTIDHDMELPTPVHLPYRDFQGQQFCHHLQKEAIWKPWKIEGFEFRDSGISEATAGLASVHIARALVTDKNARQTSHDADILFTFIIEGEMELIAKNQEPVKLHKGDAYVIPPDMKYAVSALSENLEILEVSLPGSDNTSHH